MSDIFTNFSEKARNLIRAAWGDEYFPSTDTSPENNMSVIQYANICENKILLTGDAGRSAFEEAADYAPNVGLYLPCKIHRFQVPHHGSRHNVSTEVLDKWLGEKESEQSDSTKFSAIISASKEDKDHPRKSVIRGFMHRGASVITTEEASKCTSSKYAPNREGWTAATPVSYPSEQEE